MKRISKQAQAVADAHIAARRSGNFDDPMVSTKSELIAKLREGKTFSALMSEAELHFCLITSVMIARRLSHESRSYRSGIYKAFKQLLD